METNLEPIKASPKPIRFSTILDRMIRDRKNLGFAAKAETIVLEYHNQKDMQRGIVENARRGWELKNTTVIHHHPGCLLIILCILTFGIYALFVHGHDTYICTFAHVVS